MPRSKYDKQNRRYHSYCKKRKRSQSETRVLKRSLIHLLDKLIGELKETVEENCSRLDIPGSFRKRVTHLVADRIYAINYNCKYCSKRKITTSFIRKERASKNEIQAQHMRSLLNKERSTRLEGSFGTEKQHYSPDKVKARTKPTEILWIFFEVILPVVHLINTGTYDYFFNGITIFQVLSKFHGSDPVPVAANK